MKHRVYRQFRLSWLIRLYTITYRRYPTVSCEEINEILSVLERLNSPPAINQNRLILPGRPRPRVVWFLENTVIDDSFENRSDGVVVNHLTFPNVGRQHLHARLICQATNNNIVPPETKAVVLDINCK